MNTKKNDRTIGLSHLRHLTFQCDTEAVSNERKDKQLINGFVHLLFFLEMVSV